MVMVHGDQAKLMLIFMLGLIKTIKKVATEDMFGLTDVFMKEISHKM